MFIPATEAKTYTITHTTGIGPYNAGDEGENYFFTLVGAQGETLERTCPANRKKGQIGSCSFKDYVLIGELNAVRIKNIVTNKWAIVVIEVGIDGLTGSWRYSGNTLLPQEGMITLNLQYTSRYTLN